MSEQHKRTKKVGLVLEGGGGLGAYQIGVWKALRETGLEKYITSVAGSSVGGLNAALFIQNDLEKAESIWKNISPEKILTRKSKSDHGHVRPSLFERDGLEEIIDKNLNMRCFENSDYNCWMTCARTDGSESSRDERDYAKIYGSYGKEYVRKYMCGNIDYFNLKYVENDEIRKKIILATSAMPIFFPGEEIDGHTYKDGGSRIYHGDNAPVKPLYEIDQCNIILIVHLRNMRPPIDKHKFPEASLYELFPRENSILGILDFTAEGAVKRMRLGYNENIDLFRNLKEDIDREKSMEKMIKEAWEYEKEMQKILRRQDEEIEIEIAKINDMDNRRKGI